MRRVVSLFLPTWPTDRLRRAGNAPPRDKPLVTARPDHARRVLASVDAPARALGLVGGMAVAQAQALVPDLAVVDAQPEEDAAALARLALWCLRYAPIVAPDGADGIVIDVKGAAHLHGGEAALLRDLVGRLRGNGIAARAALAPTPATAWALARFGESGTIVAAERDVAEAIAPLSLAALRLPAETVDALRNVGFERIGDLMGQPKGAFIRRFGAALTRRLAQALGQEPELIEPIFPPELPQCRHVFAEPIAAPEDLQRVAADLCAALCRRLEARGLGARRLDLVFRRVDNARQAIRIGTARPSRDPRHLARLLAERLPFVDPGFGIESALLVAGAAEELDARQTMGRHVGEDDREADLGALVDRVAVRLLERGPYRLAAVESHIPERSQRRTAPLAPADGASWSPRLTRPQLLVHPPEPIVALNTDQPPRLFTWRGARRSVVRADGPERIHGEWWVADEEAALVRDYYRVETEAGERFWLFRDAPAAEGGAWFLHGVFA